MGLYGAGIRTLAKYCGYNTSMIYTYFKDFDDLIVNYIKYYMSKIG
ncbi:MAG: TetR/AcrR family transcriptional regulator [Oscillospiraceae bacterium]|nr:TetR/AcrR family transcriptional regulator [Oscillospiraceae bacterium]